MTHKTVCCQILTGFLYWGSGGGGLVVSLFALYFDNPSLNSVFYFVRLKRSEEASF